MSAFAMGFALTLAVRRIKPRAFLGLRDRAKVSTQKPGPPENHQKIGKKSGNSQVTTWDLEKKNLGKGGFPPKT
jgi:hypothetical protein